MAVNRACCEPASDGWSFGFPSRWDRLGRRLTRHLCWRTGYKVVLQVYRRGLKRARELAQFREFKGYRFPLWSSNPLGCVRTTNLEGRTVKPFSLLKIPALLLGFGALLFFAPACKAQSEVNPDHFDGTDPWEIAARRSVTPRVKPGPMSGLYQAENKKVGPAASLQLAAVRELQIPAHRNTVAVRDKRKPAVRPSDQK